LPNAGLGGALQLGQLEAGRLHQLSERRGILQHRRIHREVAVGCVLGDRQSVGSSAQIDRLGTGQDHRGALGP
jgi:hypothetical protein